ncbi:MAG: ABC transporter permease [Candidatus Pacearchaeota archaeon]
MIRDYLLFAVRNIKRRGVRSILTLLGIIIGIATVVSLISLGDGLQNAVLSQFGISSTEIITVQAGGISAVGPPGTGVSKPLTDKDVEDIERINSVDVAIARHIETVRLEFNDKLTIGTAGDVPDGEKRKIFYDIVEIEPEYGKLLEQGDANRVVLGNNFYFADKNGFDKRIDVGDKVTINDKDYQVKGILKKKGSFIFDNIILLNEETLSEISNYGETVDLISVKVKQKDLLDETVKSIEEVLRKNRDVSKGEEDFEVSTPEGALAEVNQIITGIQIFVVMIAAISIFIGAIGIVNTMTTSVLERVKEIGVMKAIGAKNKDIFYQFFIEAGFLGLVGGIIGIIFGTALGYFGTLAINSFLGAETAPQISLFLILTTLLGSFLLGAISGIIPAITAANKNPVEALRNG